MGWCAFVCKKCKGNVCTMLEFTSWQPPEPGPQEKEQTPAQNEIGQHQPAQRRGAGMRANPDPLPASGRQKIEHLFVFKLCFISPFFRYTQNAKRITGQAGAGSVGQGRCTGRTMEPVGGSLGLPKAPSVPLLGR